jgi:hypothetical protein
MQSFSFCLKAIDRQASFFTWYNFLIHSIPFHSIINTYLITVPTFYNYQLLHTTRKEHNLHSLTHLLHPSHIISYHIISFHPTSAPLHSTPLHSTPLHSTPLHSTPLHSTPLHSLACMSACLRCLPVLPALPASSQTRK